MSIEGSHKSEWLAKAIDILQMQCCGSCLAMHMRPLHQVVANTAALRFRWTGQHTHMFRHGPTACAYSVVRHKDTTNTGL